MARKGVVIGIIVILLVVGGLLLTGIIPTPDDNTSYMEITFYDADGNELGKADDTLSIFGIRSPDILGDKDIDHLDVVVYFKITTDVDYTYTTSRCDMSIETRLNTYSGGIVHTIAEHRLGAINSDLEGTFYATYLVSTLLPDSKIDSAGKEYGWTMKFSATVTSQVGYDASDNIEATDTCGITLTLFWNEGTVSVEAWFGDW